MTRKIIFYKIRLLTLLLITISVSMNLHAQKIKVLDSFAEIKDLLLSRDKVNEKNFMIEDYQLESNAAFVYQLDDGRILMSSNSGTEGLIFANKELFDEAVSSGYFPIEDPPDTFADYRKEFEEPEKYLPIFLKKLLPLGQKGWPDRDGHDSSLVSLSGAMNGLGRKNIGFDTWVAVGMFIGELARREYDGEWKSHKEYEINPYFTPYLALPNCDIALWKWVWKQEKSRKKIDLVEVLKDIRYEMKLLEY